MAVGGLAGVGSWIDRRARIAPDQVALVHGDVRCTYDELAGRVRRLARALQELGVGYGDRVLWLGANHPAFLELFFATAKLGGILAPVNHRLERSVIDALVADYAATVAVVGPDAVELALPNVPSRVAVRASTATDVPYEDLLARAPDGAADRAVAVDDVCLMPHTSGTTGEPKGVMLTHGNVTWNVVNLLSLVDFRSDDVTVAIAPFFRTGGTGVNVLPVLFKGGTVVIPETSDPGEILRLLERGDVTVGFGNPDLLDALIRLPGWADADLGRFRCFITGGAPVPERLIRTYLDRGVPLLQGYGLSEAAPFVLLLDAPSALRKVGSAGKPALFVDVRTVRPDGTPCASGQTGELLVRGPNVMAGYWNRPDATRAVIDDDGWLHSGDAARIDDDGDAWIVDRMVDAYDTPGGIVHPGDVERAFESHPAVGEVAVVAHDGVSTAFVVVTSGATPRAQELLEFARERLEQHEVPMAVVFRDALPRNSVGKLLRSQLVDRRDARAAT